MTQPRVIDYAKEDRPVDVPAARRRVAREFGKSAFAQRLEVRRLNRAYGMLTAQEYYSYRLYDDRHSDEAKRRFIGVSRQTRILRCAIPAWARTVAHDKITFQTVMAAHGFPVGRVVAAYHPYRWLPGVARLHRREDLAAFLRGAEYPLFAKPVDGLRSEGSTRLDAYDAGADEVVAHTGARLGVGGFVEAVERFRKTGYLLQEVQHPHPRVRALCGDRLATLRLVLLVGDGGPELFRACWKVPAGPHVADNFWRQGNLLAALDPATGRVTRVVTGQGFEQREVDRHPDTGVPLLGFEIPEWRSALDACLAAAVTMPRVTMQGWDVAVCDRGPVLIEVNNGGDFILPQMASDAGYQDARFREYLREHRCDAGVPPGAA